MKIVFWVSLLLITSLSLVSAQTKIYRESYTGNNLIKGIYEAKSQNIDWLVTAEINPQIQYPGHDSTAFYPLQNDFLILFKNPDPATEEDVAGVLRSASFLEVLEIDYRKIYRDFTKEWAIYFEVWKKIRINDKIYYTDADLQDFIGFKKQLPQFNQTVLLSARSTGYDDYYDNGYPEEFRFLVVDENQELIYQSELLPFECGCEFWEIYGADEHYLKNTTEYFQFTLSGWSYNPETKKSTPETYIGRWDGKQLTGAKTIDK